MPLIALVVVLPGKQDMAVWVLKRLIVNMITVPIMVFFFMFGLGILATFLNVNAEIAGGVGDGGFWYYVIGFGIWGALIKLFIGLGIMWQGLRVRGALEGALGAGGSISKLIRSEEKKK